MSFSKDALPVDEIRQILSIRLKPLTSESIALTSTLGRVAADSILATSAEPRFDKAAMDGYAIHSEDLGGGVLEQGGESLIGHALNLTLSPGRAIYVSTGSPVPDNAGAVVPMEQVRTIDGAIVVGSSTFGKHIIRRGERIRQGATIVDIGEEIRLSKIALLATQGLDEVQVVRRPTVAFFATGDEVSPSPATFQVVDSITPVVHAWRHFLGLEMVACGQLPDDLAVIEQALSTTTADLVITSGGASVGRKDFTRKAVANLAEIIVPGICVKPGSPAFIAVRGDQTILGLPGNPNAAAHQLELLGGLIVDRLCGNLQA